MPINDKLEEARSGITNMLERATDETLSGGALAAEMTLEFLKGYAKSKGIEISEEIKLIEQTGYLTFAVEEFDRGLKSGMRGDYEQMSGLLDNARGYFLLAGYDISEQVSFIKENIIKSHERYDRQRKQRHEDIFGNG